MLLLLPLLRLSLLSLPRLMSLTSFLLFALVVVLLLLRMLINHNVNHPPRHTRCGVGAHCSPSTGLLPRGCAVARAVPALRAVGRPHREGGP